MACLAETIQLCIVYEIITNVFVDSYVWSAVPLHTGWKQFIFIMAAYSGNSWYVTVSLVMTEARRNYLQ